MPLSRNIFFILLLLTFRTALADTVTCHSLLPQLLRELEEQGANAVERLTTPSNLALAQLQRSRGYLAPQGFLLGHEGDYAHYPNLLPEDLREVHQEIAGMGGHVYRLEGSSAAFSVTAAGEPYLLLPSETNGALLDHERNHFLLWRDLRAVFLGRMPKQEASLLAYDVMTTPEGNFRSESRAIAAELRRLQSWDWVPEDTSEVLGMANYPHVNALHEGFSFMRRLHEPAQANFPHRISARLNLQIFLNESADAILRRTRWLTGKHPVHFPSDYLSLADVQLFEPLSTWPQLRTLLQERSRLPR